MGGSVAVDESCVGDRYLYDPTSLVDYSKEGMFTALASRYVMPCICPTFSPNGDRVTRLRRMASEFGITGVVYYVLKGCILYDFELGSVEQAMKEIDIPLIRIESDYNPEDVEQVRTRIEAFVEMLHQKGRKNRG
jgi:benzoyl-CoA reductase/2-hydroxyglutaryl-CoA dehydratase subunit BcrC/BadD/HgdB